MSAERAITYAFLIVSVFGLGVQGSALAHLHVACPGPGLLRTAICRVICAVLYLGVGINALAPRWAVLQVSFCVFCVTQAIWQVNAWLDVWLARRLSIATNKKGRHP